VILCAPGFAGQTVRNAPPMHVREYRLVVDGVLGDRLRLAFPRMTVSRGSTRTVLAGPVRDQAELQRLLRRISGLGLTLVSAEAVGEREIHMGERRHTPIEPPRDRL
jgi:hypothetical protein